MLDVCSTYFIFIASLFVSLFFDIARKCSWPYANHRCNDKKISISTFFILFILLSFCYLFFSSTFWARCCTRRRCWSARQLCTRCRFFELPLKSRRFVEWHFSSLYLLKWHIFDIGTKITTLDVCERSRLWLYLYRARPCQPDEHHWPRSLPFVVMHKKFDGIRRWHFE